VTATVTPVSTSDAHAQLDFLGVADDEVIELQALGVETSYGSATRHVYTTRATLDAVIAAAPKAVGHYLIGNALHPQATTRSPRGKWSPMAKGESTTDADVSRRRLMIIDCDAPRPKGTSASDEQKAPTLTAARAIMADLGVPAGSMALIDSGNGHQVWLRIDAPPECPDVKRILTGLASYSTDRVKVDTSVHEAKRLVPLASTLKRKGAHSAEYPHRPVRVVSTPDTVVPLSEGELRALADRLAPPDKLELPRAKSLTGSVYDRANATNVHDLASRLGLSRDGDNVECPGCGRHSGSMAAIVGNGIKCQSHSCASHRDGFYTPVDTLAAVKGITPLDAARELAGESAPVAANDNVQILSVADLYAPQTDAAFLVKDLGIAPGAPTFLVGQGYVGKTIMAMSLGVSVAAGRPIWGQPWEPTRCGSVLHLDYEQGRRVTSKRFQRLAAGLGVERDELEGRWGCVVLPTFDLTSSSAADTYSRLCEGRSLVILDSLKGATPGVEENSSAIRDHVRALTAASERTGAVVLVIHHAGKTPMQGTRPRKEMGRGSSAIYDEAQTWFTITGEKGAPFLVSHEKDRERGQTVEDFNLQIVDTEGGGLAVAGAEVEERPDPEARAAQRDGQLQALVESYVTENPSGPFSAEAIARGTKSRRVDAAAAVAALLRDGRIVNVGSAHRPRYVPGLPQNPSQAF